MLQIYILILRQLRKYFSAPSRMIGTLGQPLLVLVAADIGVGPLFSQAGMGNYINFLTPGVITLVISLSSISSGSEILKDKSSGFLKGVFVAPVFRYEVIIAKMTGSAVISLFNTIMILIVALFLGFHITTPESFFLTILSILLVSVVFSEITIFLAIIVRDIEGYELVMNLIILPLAFLSGAFFPLIYFPKLLLLVAALNPLTYGVDALRASLIASSRFGILLDLSVLALLSIIPQFLIRYAFARLRVQ